MSSIKSDHGTKLLKAVASDAIILVVFIKLSCNNRAFVQLNVIVIELVNDGKGIIKDHLCPEVVLSPCSRTTTQRSLYSTCIQ